MVFLSFLQDKHITKDRTIFCFSSYCFDIYYGFFFPLLFLVYTMIFIYLFSWNFRSWKIWFVTFFCYTTKRGLIVLCKKIFFFIYISQRKENVLTQQVSFFFYIWEFSWFSSLFFFWFFFYFCLPVCVSCYVRGKNKRIQLRHTAINPCTEQKFLFFFWLYVQKCIKKA